MSLLSVFVILCHLKQDNPSHMFVCLKSSAQFQSPVSLVFKPLIYAQTVTNILVSYLTFQCFFPDLFLFLTLHVPHPIIVLNSIYELSFLSAHCQHVRRCCILWQITLPHCLSISTLYVAKGRVWNYWLNSVCVPAGWHTAHTWYLWWREEKDQYRNGADHWPFRSFLRWTHNRPWCKHSQLCATTFKEAYTHSNPYFFEIPRKLASNL